MKFTRYLHPCAARHSTYTDSLNKIQHVSENDKIACGKRSSIGSSNNYNWCEVFFRNGRIFCDLNACNHDYYRLQTLVLLNQINSSIDHRHSSPHLVVTCAEMSPSRLHNNAVSTDVVTSPSRSNTQRCGMHFLVRALI